MIALDPRLVSEQAVLAAVREVSDPELDESLVDLGFLDSVRVHGGRVEVVLRLPTFWCAPNFAYLMAHDVREQALRVPGVREVRVVLKDHMYADEITRGVSADQPFDAIFPGQADGIDLDALRDLFRRKAFGMRQEQLVRFLLGAGLTDEDVIGLRLDDVLDVTDGSGLRLRVGGAERLLEGGAALARAYLVRRGRIGVDEHGSARLVTDLAGAPIVSGGLPAHLDHTRRQRVSMTFNAIMCRGMLATRYGLGPERERGADVNRSEAT